MVLRTRSTRVLERAATAARSDPGADGAVRMSVTDGGLRIVTESVPGVRSAAVGVWVGIGSVDETPGLAGASHFLEHLLFKGTRHRTGHQIAATMDAVGGEFNAFTSHEYTCYYAHVLAEHAPLAIDVLGDVVLHATVSGSDVETERQVILEEIAMRDDDPEDLLADAFAEAVFAGHPVSGSVLGSTASVEALTRTQIAGYYRRRYHPERMVVAVAGDVDHGATVRAVKRAFADRLGRNSATRPAPRRSGIGRVRPDRRIKLVPKPGEQAHLMVGGAGLRRDDPRRHAFSVLTTGIGGGMSSRLFRAVREERGLAYSCYATGHAYADIGSFSVYAGCHPAALDEVCTVIDRELAEVAAHGLDPEEVERAKGQLTGSLVLGLEDTESRMARIGRNVLVREQFRSVADEITALAAVTSKQVGELAAELLSGPLFGAVVGPYRRRSELPSGVGRLLSGPAAAAAPGRGRRAARVAAPRRIAGEPRG